MHMTVFWFDFVRRNIRNRLFAQNKAVLIPVDKCQIDHTEDDAFDLSVTLV